MKVLQVYITGGDPSQMFVSWGSLDAGRGGGLRQKTRNEALVNEFTYMRNDRV